MGRIAEALKRAQEERHRRLNVALCDRTESVPVEARESVSPWDPFCRAGTLTDEPDLTTALLTPPGGRIPRAVGPPVAPESIDPRILAFHKPACAIAEKYRSVRTRLLTSNPGGSARVHAVSSTLRQEGRSVTVANLGFSLAELRHLRVAVVDFDLRQRGLTGMFDASGRPGLAEVLRGEKPLAEACVPAGRDNLHLIPAGQVGGENSSDLLAGKNISAVFRDIGERYHYALVDTPPIHTCADIGLIGPLCHSVLIVIRMHRTPEPLLRRSVKMLQANHLLIAGCILVGASDEALSFNDEQDVFAGALP